MSCSPLEAFGISIDVLYFKLTDVPLEIKVCGPLGPHLLVEDALDELHLLHRVDLHEPAEGPKGRAGRLRLGLGEGVPGELVAVAGEGQEAVDSVGVEVWYEKN